MNAQIRFKVDRVSLNAPIIAPGNIGTFTTVNLTNSYTNPVVFVLPTDQNPDPATVRIQNITANSFDLAVIEPENSFTAVTGITSMDIHYFVAEAGVYNLGGVQMEVANATTNALLDTSQFQGRNAIGTESWQNIAFLNTYSSAPTVLMQVQSSNNETLNPLQASTLHLETTAQAITTTSMDIALERSETFGALATTENFAYLAIESNVTGTIAASAGNVNFQTFSTSNTIDNNCTNFTYNNALLGSTPLVVANQNTRNGVDGGWLARCNLSATQVGFFVNEDFASDNERNHTNEIAGAILFANSFDASVSGLNMEAGVVTTPAQLPTGSNTLNFTSVAFPNQFASDNVLIFAIPTDEGAEPAALRLRSIDRNGFEIAQVEPQGATGAHESMTIDYIAIEAGSYELPNNVTIEAGSLSTAQTIAGGSVGGYTPLTFASTFAAPPVLLTQVQSVNSEPTLDPSNISSPWLTSAVESGSVSTTNASVALERAEATAGTVVAETIAYLAIDASVDSSFLDNLGNPIRYQSIITGDTIEGGSNGDGCFETNFISAFSSGTVRAVASPRSRDGGDGYWFRRCLLDNNQIGLFADEDQANDGERGHTTEIASVLAFSNSFESSLEAQLTTTKTVNVLNDPINATNPKAIRGAELEYIVQIENPRAGAADTIIIEDALPDNVALFVGVGATTFPFTITNNTDEGAGNTLNFSAFVSFGDITDSYAFSDDNGATYDYVPQDPDNDGYDPAVTNFRITPTGTIGGADATYTGQIEIRYQVLLN